MQHDEYRKGEYVISTDRARLDLSTIHVYLSLGSYWALGRTKEAVATSIEHSLCFGVYAADGSQAGFARVLTDEATLGNEALAKFKTQAFETLRGLKSHDGIHQRFPVLYTVASKP